VTVLKNVPPMDKRIVLPKNLRPSNYKVTLIPGLETFRFSGQVSITLNVIESTKTIIANANDLEISSCRLVVLQSEKMLNWPVDENTQRPSIPAREIKLNKEATTVEFHFEYEIPQRAIVMLHVEFIGNHNDQMVGFYRSQYKDEQGNKKHLVVTQFEAVDCRRCFPCWDEPNLKATFDITLIVPKNTTALSNMNIIKQNDIKIGEYVLNCVEFATTPIMSTYLVAMAVGEFDYLEAVANPKLPADSKPIVCRTYTLKGQSHLGKFSLDVAVKTLEFFSEYFDIAYPLPKMDMIAIPDFAAGGIFYLN
jgi:aminopeptidase 2